MSSTEVGDLQQMQLSQMQPETLQKDKQWRRNGKEKDTADTVKGAYVINNPVPCHFLGSKAA